MKFRRALSIRTLLHFASNAFKSQIRLFFLYLLLTPLSTQADPVIEEQIRQLEASLSRLHQNQQNIFQQFQMIQELRRFELTQEEEIISSPLTGSVMSETLPSYEEMVKRREARQKRLQQYTSDLDQLYSRYQDLEAERQFLIEQINNLAKSFQEKLVE